MRKDKQGISLIVLVITIIIMIILAAAIIISLENTGIINTAEQAVCKTNIKQAQNLAVLTWSNIYTKPDEYTIDNVEDKLREEFEKNGLKYEDYNVEVTKNGINVSSKAGCTDSSGVEGGSGNTGSDTIPTNWDYAYAYNNSSKMWTATEASEGSEPVGDIIVKLYKNGTMEYYDMTFDTYDMRVSGTGEFDSFKEIPIGNRFTSSGIEGMPVDNLITNLEIQEGITSIVNFKIPPFETSFPFLKTIQLPNSLALIGEDGFNFLESLETVKMGSGLKIIQKGAFKNDSLLKNINLPEELTKIGEYAFSNTAIENIVIPDNVTEIGEWAFEGCDSLETMVIPKSLTIVGQKTFDCINLKTIYFKGTKTEWEAISGITSASIPDTVNIEYNYTGN